MTTYNEIIKIATYIKTYVEKNHKFPTTVKIGSNSYNYGQCAYLLSNSILNLGKNITLKSVKNANKSSGDNLNIKVYASDYKDQAKRINQYIKQNGQCPNYVTLVTSKKHARPRDFIYAFARILVYYKNNKNTLPKYATYNSSIYKTTSASSTKTTTKTTTKTSTSTSSTSSKCTNPYTSSPHYTNQGAGYLGQTTPYTCGPHSLMQCFRKFGWELSESKLAQVAGTTTSGSSHQGLETAIAWVAKQKGVKLNVTWKNFSDFGSNDSARYKAIGEIACKSNKAVFFHIGYQNTGATIGGEIYGHYEMSDKFNISTKYVRALNSLGTRQGNGYYGHLQDRSFSVQSHYISNISQKSVCIITKE